MDEAEKDTRGKWERTKEAVAVSWRLVCLVFKVDPFLFSLTFATTLVPAIIPFVNAYLYKLIIDLVVEAIKGEAFDFRTLYILIAIRAGSYFLAYVATAVQDYVERILWLKTPIKLNDMILEKLTGLDIEYFEDPKFRDLLEKVKEAIGFRPQNLLSYIMFSAQTFLQLTIALIAIINLNWILVLLISFIAIAELLNQTHQADLAWGIWFSNSPERKKFWYLSNLMADFRSIREIKIFELASTFIKDVRGIQQKFFTDQSKLAKRAFSYGLLFNGLSSAVFIGFEIYVVLQAVRRKVTVGDINFYTDVVEQFQNGISGFFRNVGLIFENALYVKSLFDLFDLEPRLNTSGKNIKLKRGKAPKIEFRNVDFSYPGSEEKLLDNFSLTINPGEHIALVGENGAGKSTIIKLLARFYDVTGGEILIDSKNIKDLDVQDWYRHIGVLFQEFNRYDYSAKDNIEFGKVYAKSDFKEIVRAAKESGADKVIDKFKDKYDQILGKTFKGGMELSWGQWQKIALGRAFFRDPEVLILDEPTASIDAKSEAEIFDKVQKMPRSKTVIIISHRFSTVRNADKIYVIENGKIVEAGNHEELMKKDGQYASLFKLQAKGYR